VEFLQAQMVFLPGAGRLAALHDAELPQKDDLCGAFWGTLALRAAGFEEHDGAPIDQDEVARAAGSTVSAGGHRDALPAGEQGRRDYRLDLPRVAEEASGTSAAGVAHAVEELSDGALTAVPVRGPWSAESVRLLLGHADSASPPLTLIVNVDTGQFWGSRAAPAQLLSYLSTGEHDPGPARDWSVGHFVGLVGSAHGQGGTLVAIADTYRSLGWQGMHLQPVERLAAALERGDGREGGVLAVVSADARPRLESRLRNAGFRCGLWDNGTPRGSATA
jgi:hypothetical protein